VGARSPQAKVTLTVHGTGSTAGGTVTARGGLSCTIGRTGSATGRCDADYKSGFTLTLTAVPAPGAVLAEWIGCTGASEHPRECSVTMDTERTITAVFAPPPNSYTLTVAGGAAGSGRVTSTPAGIDCTITEGTAAGAGCSAAYPTGQGVTLSATAASGAYLKAWSGAGCEANGTGVGGAGGQCALSMSETRNVVVSFDVRSVNASLGRWATPSQWAGGVAIHAHLLPTGHVMSWGIADANPVVWNPQDGAFTSVARPVDLFCSGHALLPDGRLLVSGGHASNDHGLLATVFYDPATRGWTSGPRMRNGRWYPTTTTLANGDVLTVSGGDTLGQRNLIPEVYQQATNSWRELSSASLYLPYYPFLFVAPDARVFAAGPSQGTYFLTPAGTGSWAGGPRSHYGDRDYGSAVMYDAGKIVMMGGGGPTASTEVIDLNAGAGAAWRTVAPMSVPRRQLTATLLADGQVLVTGGTNAGGFNAAPTSAAVLAAEVWNPATEQWRTLARMAHYRLYHSTALLLPDGRVLVAGSGQPAAGGLTDNRTAELFSPPYLFNPDGTEATRPTIGNAPTTVGYGQSFRVATPEAASIGAVHLIRLGSVTHAFDMNQRMNRLAFTAGATTLAVVAPERAALAPPGHYMLFLIDRRGVPSVARIVRLG
jgi:hypothetical protein